MTVRTFIAGIIFCAFIGLISLVSILTNVDPAQGPFAIFSFYLSLSILSVSFLTLIGFFIRRKVFPKSIPFSLASTSFRQAMLLSVVIVGTLFFQGIRILSWWNMALLVASVVALELYFISR